MKSRSFCTQLHQRGMTLFITVSMLIVMTLIVLASIRMTNVNLRIAGNMQHEKEALAAGQQAIETMISSSANFYTPTASTYNISNSPGGGATYTVNIAAPLCQKISSVPGYSASFSLAAPQDSFWDITAVVTDSVTGASITIHQGVTVRLDSTGTCP
ncbi:MAG: Tfp pilus assembly protein PilX [Porticoccaceae bacterium]|jgi:Tfp pilus assembly protein PilX